MAQPEGSGLRLSTRRHGTRSLTRHRVAASALQDPIPGPRRMQCTLAEAFALAGLAAQDLQGGNGWYTTPDASVASQDPRSPLSEWTVGVTTDLATNLKGIQRFKEAFGQDLEAPKSPSDSFGRHRIP